MYLRVHCMHCVVYACGHAPICPTPHDISYIHATRASVPLAFCFMRQRQSDSNDRCYPRMHFAARKLLMAPKCGVFAVLSRPVFYFILFNNLFKLNRAERRFRLERSLPICTLRLVSASISLENVYEMWYFIGDSLTWSVLQFITQSSGLATIQSELCIIYPLILKMTLGWKFCSRQSTMTILDIM